jgi:hypothetical protein
MTLFNLSQQVLQLAGHNVTVQRLSADAYGADGLRLPRNTVTLSMRASVQPISGADLRRLPEGLHVHGMVSVHSASPLQMRDRITVPGSGTYEVEYLYDGQTNGAYSKALARKSQQGEGAP